MIHSKAFGKYNSLFLSNSLPTEAVSYAEEVILPSFKLFSNEIIVFFKLSEFIK